MMKYLRRRAGGLLILALLVTGLGSAGESSYPKRSMMTVKGKQQPVYLVGGFMYRELDVASLHKAELGEPVALFGRLMAIDSQRLQLFGEEFESILFSVGEGLEVPSRQKGSNLLVCGVLTKKAGEGIGFSVRAVRLMPDDFALMAEREERARAQPGSKALALVSLGDWIEKSRGQSQILDDARFARYEKERNRLYGEGLAAELEGLKPTPEVVTERLEQLLLMPNTPGKPVEGNGEKAYLAYTRSLLLAAPEVTRAVENEDDLSDLQAAVVTGCGRYGVAILYRDLLRDTTKYRALLLEAAKLAPLYEALSAPMKKLGYQLVNRRWVTQAEAAAARERTQA
ncbi:MAG: hypothetical protein ACYTGH_20010, partial [Planctomycetota bacterium]